MFFKLADLLKGIHIFNQLFSILLFSGSDQYMFIYIGLLLKSFCCFLKKKGKSFGSGMRLDHIQYFGTFTFYYWLKVQSNNMFFNKNLNYFLHQFFLQNTLSSQVVHNALAAADHLVLGVVKVWGAGHVRITEATLTDSEGKTHPLTLDHNLETQVSRVVKCSSFRFTS